MTKCTLLYQKIPSNIWCIIWPFVGLVWWGEFLSSDCLSGLFVRPYEDHMTEVTTAAAELLQSCSELIRTEVRCCHLQWHSLDSWASQECERLIETRWECMMCKNDSVFLINPIIMHFKEFLPPFPASPGIHLLPERRSEGVNDPFWILGKNF